MSILEKGKREKSNMDITMRLAIPTDTLDMAEIHMRSWEVAYKDIIPMEYIQEKNKTRLALYKRIIKDDNTTQYVIQNDGNTVGIMSIDPLPQDDDAIDNMCELASIYLHPNYFRQGIGTKAMEFVCNIAREWKKTIMIVWVFAENTNSIEFYEKCGFIADGSIKHIHVVKSWNVLE